MKWDEFAAYGRKIADWAQAYHLGLRDRPVRARTRPGEILAALPATPPDAAEPMDRLLAEVDDLLMPGITHWQHPRFFAYFPANAAPASVLATRQAASLCPASAALLGRAIRL